MSFSWKQIATLSGMMLYLGLGVLLQPATAQQCTHLLSGKNVVNAQYYDDADYRIHKITLHSPFSFFFLVSRQLDALKKSLPIQEGGEFSEAAYNQAARTVEDAVQRDSVFGENFRVKIVVAAANLENCDESEDHKTVDVVYRVISTDPIPSVYPVPDRRATISEQSNPEVAERNTQGGLKLKPSGGYTHSFGGFGGGEADLKLPGNIFDRFVMRGAGSPKAMLLNGQFSGSSSPGKQALAKAEYYLGYRYDQNPTQNFEMNLGAAQARFIGISNVLGTGRLRTSLRYGESLEQGLQQSSVQQQNSLPNTISNSSYGAVRVYIGTTTSTRYSETIASYGLAVAGDGLSDLTFVKQVGDVSYALRLPGHSHSPWDVQLRLTGGGITGGPILLNERFFGGNVVAPFIPGDTWLIPNGPMVRSITANYLNGAGYGGTSFYSTNVTVGKVLKYSPLIPTEVERTPGFGSGISAAEDTAEGFFFDTNLSKTDGMTTLVKQYQEILSKAVRNFQNEFSAIRGEVPISAKLNKALKDEERAARLSLSALDAVDGTTLRQLYGSKSRLVSLLDGLPALLALTPEPHRSQLQNLGNNLQKKLDDLKQAFADLEQSPEGKAAKAQATKDMERPREVIDTLRCEANMFALSIFGVFDTGRVWPDPIGTRYAYGGGVRLSVVNVNFNLGYAANPNPQPQLHQGSGALLFSITYTNLFR